MSVGAVKAVEIGDGIAVSNAIGSENNDSFFMEGEKIAKRTNHSGGSLGGMSDGSCLILRASIKPTSSISRQQHTVTVEGQDTEISIHGRHDPVIVPRAVVVIESMTAITLADLLLQNMASKMEHVKKIYAEDKNVEETDLYRRYYKIF